MTDVAQFRVVTQHPWQSVIGNTTAEVMHVVNTYVGREPAQERRQFVMGAAEQRCMMQVPVLIAFPRRMLELMLNVEQPNADRCRENRSRKMHEQKRLDADQPCKCSHDGDNREIGRHCADPGLPTGAHQADREPLLQKK